MNLSDLLEAAIDALEAEHTESPATSAAFYTHARARAMVEEERRLERVAAEQDGIKRAEIIVDDKDVFGTLRFLSDDGHLHGLLFARRGVHLWVAYAFAGDLMAVDAAALLARLRGLGNPYMLDDERGGGRGGKDGPGGHTPVRSPAAGEG